LRRTLRPLGEWAAEAGLSVYAVGGCVRDALLSRLCRDLDLVVEGDPRPLARAAVRRWGGRSESFGRFGTVRVHLGDGVRIDLARSRAESYARPAALPSVRTAPIERDLGRRDFTVNAMARPLGPAGFGKILDFHGGREDLRARRLRLLHPESFSDDPTRLFRAARYAGRFGFRLESATASRLKSAVQAGVDGLLSRERVRQELFRILDEKDPRPAMALLRGWGLLRTFHPRFVFPEKARKGGAMHRLGLCVLAMGRDGGELLDSLPLERSGARELGLALKSAEDERSPREAFPPLALGVLRAHFERLPESAFQPLLLRGSDLQRAGMKPGPGYKRLLSDAARAQWSGEFSTRAQALRWLKKNLGTRE